MQNRPPYRAEHVGSMPRPPELMAARQAFAKGSISRENLREVEDHAIHSVLALQERVGIGAITDGEYRRRAWRDYLYERLEGFGPETAARDFPIRQFDGTLLKPAPEFKVTSKIRRREPLAADEFSAIKNMTTHPVKANIPTPSWVAFYTGEAGYDHAVYADRQSVMADVVAAMREEITDLAARGCTYLQLDEVPLAILCDPHNQEVVRGRGNDPDELIDFYIAAINASIRDRPANMAVAVHLCRGNVGRGMAEGSYEPIAERLFGGLEVDGFFLEYDTPRAGDFKPLRYLQSPKKAVLGLVSSKLASLETVDELRRRIDEATEFVPLDRLCLSPQCGFASIPSAPSLSMDDIERKLNRVVETARAVWG